MRMRTAILVTAVTASLLAIGVSPAVAMSEQAAAANAVSGRMLAVPRAQARVTRLPVRVVVRVPARTSRLRVRVGGRDVTARFRRSRGALRVAELARGDGLRYGSNHLVVLAERRGRRPMMETRSFVLARRQDDLVRVRVRPGPVTSLDVRLVVPRLAAKHFGQPAEVDRRLSAIRRERTVRVWLNGRRVTRALDRSQLTRWTASLSASHGLRYGVNRLRIVVAESERGRYASLRRRFVVRRSRHLAAAGWDTATRVGGRVRLDGSRSRTIRGGRADHTWRILAKPRGSRARLRHAGSARPLLTPDRRGRYVVGLTVRARAGRATASQATASSADRVTLTAGSDPLLVPFKGIAVQDGKPGIKVGDDFYPNPSPNGAGLQWLTLDRTTLLPTKTGNTWLDGTGSGDHGMQTLTKALSPCPPPPQPPPAEGCEGQDQLVILSFPYGRSSGPPVQKDQNDAFNGAIKTLGVGSIDPGILQDRNKLAIVGVPFGGEGSGWYTHGGGPVDGLTGWLMPDVKLGDANAFRFRLQPQRPAFDTASSSTSTTNTMTVGDQHFDASLPDGASGGFQVVTFDPIDLTPRDNKVFPTNSNGVGGSPLSGRRDMAKLVSDAARDRVHIAVQSIGVVSSAPPPGAEDQLKRDLADAWWSLTQALAAHGANPHTFFQASGSYAFFGGSWLKRSEVADSSSAVVLDPTRTPATREPGTLNGRLSMRRDGYWTPAATGASGSFESSLYDVVFRDPTPWPYTEGGTCAPPATRVCSDGEVDAYAKALADIADHLGFSTGLRQAYLEQGIDWTGSKTNLADMRYPGDGYTCTDDAGHLRKDPGYTRKQFCKLSAELQSEFDSLDNVKVMFSNYETALNRCGATQSESLEYLGTRIKTAVAPGEGAEIAWSVGTFLGSWYSAAILAVAPEATPVLAAWEALVAIYDLVRELVSDTKGKPVGDEVTSKVGDLAHDVSTHLFDTMNGLDRLRQVIVSDYGRLQALGPVALGPGWKIDVPQTATMLCDAAEAFFYSELMPIPYGAYALVGEYPYRFHGNPDDCYDQKYGWTWRNAPATAQMQWMGGYDHGGFSASQGRLVLGRHDLSLSYYAYPPSTLTDAMFLAPKQGGLGMQLPRFLWEQYEDVAKAPPTDIGQCH